jgi:hypothetical protein
MQLSSSTTSSALRTPDLKGSSTSSSSLMSSTSSNATNVSRNGNSSRLSIKTNNIASGSKPFSYSKAKAGKVSSSFRSDNDDDENDDNLPLPVLPENLVFIQDDQLAWIPAIRIIESPTTSLSDDDRINVGDAKATIRVKVKNYELCNEPSITLINFINDVKRQQNDDVSTSWKEIEVTLNSYPGRVLPLQSLFPKGTTSYTDMVEFDHLHEVRFHFWNECKKEQITANFVYVETLVLIMLVYQDLKILIELFDFI